MILELIAPERVLFQGEITAVNVPGKKSSFEILEHHAPMISTLQKGAIKITGNIASKEFYQEKSKFILDIKGGVVEVKKNKVVILVD